jgi:hypothetical protein
MARKWLHVWARKINNDLRSLSGHSFPNRVARLKSHSGIKAQIDCKKNQVFMAVSLPWF